MKNRLSTEPYKGTRDFYPEDMFVQNYIFRTMRECAERYGYAEYGASILEDTALYKAKSGEEIVNEQTYSFVDRGDREVTIRPEMTPTVARMVAAKRRELSFPLRWYSIPNLFRYERPQRGRLREHWQLNVDVFGMESLEADAEIITVAYDIMRRFGAAEKDFRVRINNRKLVNYVLSKHLELDEAAAHAARKLIDRKDKMEKAEFAAKSEEIAGRKAKALMEFLEVESIEDLPLDLQRAPGAEDLREMLRLIAARGIGNAVFSPSLMRGFDYYTSTVFEVFDTNTANSRSLFGGGRYDDLVGLFGVEKVSGIGFGMGDVTIRDFLETRNLLPNYFSPAEVYICTLDPEAYEYANEVAAELRAAGHNAAVDYSGRKLPAQIKTAERQHIPFILCIGEEELKTGEMKLKNLLTRKEYPARRDELDVILRQENNS